MMSKVREESTTKLVSVLPLFTKPDPPKPSPQVSKLRKMFSLRSLFIFEIVFISLLLITVFTIGIFAFITSKRNNVRIRRSNDFQVILQKVVNLMNAPKLITDSIAPALKTLLVNFSDINYEQHKNLTFWTIRDNFDRLDLDSIVFYIANSEVDKFIAYYVYPNKVTSLVRRYTGFENTTVDQIMFCNAEFGTGECKGEQMMINWDRKGSITHQSRTIYKPTFVQPYLFYCPGEMCDIYFAYTNPHHLNGQYYGTVGVAFESIALRNQLKEKTKSYASSFIVDIQSGYMLSASRDQYKCFIQPKNGDPTYQVSALDHPNKELKKVINYIYDHFGRNFSNITPGKHYSLEMGLEYYVNFERWSEDGGNWLIVLFSPIINYFADIIVISVLFIVLILVALIILLVVFIGSMLLIVKPINNLIEKMSFVENLDLDKIEKSHSSLLEVYNLENKFYYLIEKLAAYKSFLPYHLKANLNSVNSPNISDKSSSSSDSDSSYSNDFEVCSIKGQDDSNSNSSSSSLGVTSNFSPELKRFQQSVSKNNITIINFLWKISENGKTDFVERHSKLTSIIISHLKKGIIISTREDGFVVAFNTSKEIVNHSFVALQCCVQTIEKAKESNFDLYCGVCTGLCHVGIVGSKELKVQVVFGETKEKAVFLSKHAKYLGIKILTGENCFENVVENDFTLCCSDICYFPFNDEKDFFQKVFSVHRTDELFDVNEWTFTSESKTTIQKDRTKYWDFLEENKLQDCLDELVKLQIQPGLQNLVRRLIKSGTSLSAYKEHYIQKRKESLEKRVPGFSALVEIC